jgi:hypothetical protein
MQVGFGDTQGEPQVRECRAVQSQDVDAVRAGKLRYSSNRRRPQLVDLARANIGDQREVVPLGQFPLSVAGPMPEIPKWRDFRSPVGVETALLVEKRLFDRAVVKEEIVRAERRRFRTVGALEPQHHPSHFGRKPCAASSNSA